MTMEYLLRYCAWPRLAPLLVGAGSAAWLSTPRPYRATCRRAVDADLVAGRPAVGHLGSAATLALGHGAAMGPPEQPLRPPHAVPGPPGGVLPPPGGWLMDRSRFT
jgi:hypothetical protein